VAKRFLVVLGYLLASRPNLFSMGNEVEILAEGIALIPPMVCVILNEQFAPPG